MSDLPRFAVEIDDDAEADLSSIAAYIAEHQSPAIADQYLTQILDRISALEAMPLRGSMPRELENFPRAGFRQLVHGPHRIIYRVEDARVIVVLVADGRRDLPKLFAQRLMRRESP